VTLYKRGAGKAPQRRMGMKVRRGLLAAFAALAVLVLAPSAQAAPASVFGGGAPCTTLPANGNIRECGGYALSFDGTKISVNVFLPPEASGSGPYPTIGDFHGWGSAKLGLKEEGGGFTEAKDLRIQGWAEQGYAVFSMSDRGWGLSCGAFDPLKGEPNCKQGYNHLMDDRYEVRDAQVLLGDLADEGIVEPTKIGVTGESYGGGISMALAALRNREMMPNGALVPWESTFGHQKMEIAAAVPQWPWTDLSYALAPNGRNLDYVTNSPYGGPEGKYPVGVWKASWSTYLYKVGEALSNYNTSKESVANIPAWIQRLEAGDPYTDSSILGIVKLLSTYHSSFGIDPSVEPAPLLIQSGWNDDLFPVDEALRFYQRTRSQYPGDPISLYLADIGHSRSQNKEPDMVAFNQRLNAWFAHYLKGEGATPTSSVEATTTTCPISAPSGGPFRAADWAGLQPGEIRLQSTGSRTITHGTNAEEKAGTASSGPFDPIAGTKSPCTALSTATVENAHAATYSLGAAPAGGYTLMGSPTVIANVESPSPNSEIAARLLDVSPEGTESLVARGLYRPTGGDQEMVFQLHPQGYEFAAGHVAKLELLPADFPYGRFSNLQANVTVSNLELRLPVMQQPGSLGGLVQRPAPKVIPAGYTLAAEYEADQNPGGGNGGGGGTTPKPPAPAPVTKIGVGSLAGRLSATRKVLIVPLSCSDIGACSGKVSFSVPRSGKKGGTAIAKGNYSLTAGKDSSARLALTKAGRKLVKSILAEPHPSKTLSGLFKLDDSSRATSLTSRRAAQLPRSN
jgi:predicted acyl esterase